MLIDDSFIGPIGNGDMPDFMIDECSQYICDTNIETYPSEGILYCFSPVDIVNGIDDLGVENELDVYVYPNPTYGQIRILMSDHFVFANEEINIEITDINGKIIRLQKTESSIDDVLINVEDYAPGLYLVKLRGENQIIVKKIMKL